MKTKQEHIEEITEEIAEIKVEVKQAFKGCHTYNVPISEEWAIREIGNRYIPIAWDKMNADELDTMVCEIETMVYKLKDLHNALSSLGIKVRELENIDSYEHSED